MIIRFSWFWTCSSFNLITINLITRLNSTFGSLHAWRNSILIIMIICSLFYITFIFSFLTEITNKFFFLFYCVRNLAWNKNILRFYNLIKLTGKSARMFSWFYFPIFFKVLKIKYNCFCFVLFFLLLYLFIKIF